MNDKANQNKQQDIITDDIDLQEIEGLLSAQLETEFADLSFLEEEREKIGNPNNLGKVVMDTVWEQLMNNIAATAGEDFIRDNRGLTLDLRDEAHIQTTDNFADGKIAFHNDKIDYQQRYDDWQSNFRSADLQINVDGRNISKYQISQDGSVLIYDTKSGEYSPSPKSGENEKIRIDKDGHITQYDKRSGAYKKVLKNKKTDGQNARDPFDDGRPKGSATVQKDDTIPVAEIIRDPAANSHLEKQEQIDFARSDKNLGDLDARANASKGDSTMTEFLDSERDGQKPSERFDIDEEELRERDKAARKEYEKVKEEGEQKSIKTGKQSQKEEAFRISGKALRAVVMQLLAEFVKEIIRKLISWFKNAKKNMETLLDSIKHAITNFVGNLNKHLLNAGSTLITTIATAIFGPVVRTVRKIITMLKQGVKSVAEAIAYIKNPENRTKSISVLLFEVGKIVVTGASAIGALALGDAIEKGLMALPVFSFDIPLLGSLASLVGLLLGGLIMGIIGAIVINLIDKLIAKKLKAENTKAVIEKQNEMKDAQEVLKYIGNKKVETVKKNAVDEMTERHSQVDSYMKERLKEISEITKQNSKDTGNLIVVTENSEALLKLQEDLKGLL